MLWSEFQLKIFSSNLICDKCMFLYPSHVTRKKSAETEKNGRVLVPLRSRLITCERIYRPRKWDLWPVIKSSSSVLFCFLFCFLCLVVCCCCCFFFFCFPVYRLLSKEGFYLSIMFKLFIILLICMSHSNKFSIQFSILFFLIFRFSVCMFFSKIFNLLIWVFCHVILSGCKQSGI